MGLLLNIDTALDTASVSLSQDGNILYSECNSAPKDHASWMHPAVERIVTKSGLSLKQLQAVGVSIGPGSFTGLRVGLAAAKGYCFALNIPLITIGTLPIMAHSVLSEVHDLVCPVIDARRMEVFGAVYDKKLNEKKAPVAIILQSNSFEWFLGSHKILFCGSGIKKLKSILSSSNAKFSDTGDLPASLALLAEECYKKKKFSELAYSEPHYLKDFHTSTKKD